MGLRKTDLTKAESFVLKDVKRVTQPEEKQEAAAAKIHTLPVVEKPEKLTPLQQLQRYEPENVPAGLLHDNFKTPDLSQIEKQQKEHAELLKFFAFAELPSGPIQLNKWTVISDPKKFVWQTFEVLKHIVETAPAKNYLERLREFQQYLVIP